MTLFLASEGKHPKTIKELKNLIGGFAGKSICYIPTASNGEMGWEEYKKGETYNLVQTLGAKINFVQLEDYRNSGVLSVIGQPDIIWFAGGQPAYLAYWIRRCELDLYLPKILKQGTLYVGSSAGSMVTSGDLSFASWYPDEGERGAEFIPGLGLIDFEIYPHYDEEKLNYIKTHYKGHKMYLLKNGEHLLVKDNQIFVHGETRILP